MSAPSARSCERCIARAWLLGRLAGHLEQVRARIDVVLELGDEELISAVSGRQRRTIAGERERLDLAALRERTAAAGLQTICQCDPGYPAALRATPSAPAMLHIAGGLDRFLSLARQDPVAIVGARRASPYGLEVARALGRGLASAGVTVLSGMALGIDSAAHAGALSACGATIAVLPGPAHRPYPAGKRALHRQIVDTGAAVSEVPPGSAVWRWAFPARNRIIAGLAALTVVVEAGERSGALLTARYTSKAERPVGAVPGRVTSAQSAGSNALLAAGACLIRGPQDVLDLLFGVGVRDAVAERRAALSGELQALLAAIAEGHDSAGALSRAGVPVDRGLAALASLELGGYIRRGAGGRFHVVP